MIKKEWGAFLAMPDADQRKMIEQMRAGGFNDISIMQFFNIGRTSWYNWTKRNSMARKSCAYDAFKKSDTICWECANACGNCSWSRNLTPVEGWEVTETGDPTYLLSLRKIVPTVSVKSCPEFKRG